MAASYSVFFEARPHPKLPESISMTSSKSEKTKTKHFRVAKLLDQTPLGIYSTSPPQ